MRIDNPITQGAAEDFFGDNKKVIAKTYDEHEIHQGDNYCTLENENYFYEDSDHFLSYLIGKLGAPAILSELGAYEND
ncbi:hypothetical protein [Lactobacillus acetotolerans]|uniref:hypothetical protein n=1 Tax=Lactobacillus acetotolerans TaxID=1600 RepID=UPI002FD93CAC